MTSPLWSSWAKVKWAKRHVDTLKRELEIWFQREPEPAWTIAKEYEPHNSRFRFFVSEVRTFPIEWSLYLGDAVNNFRAALDHAAWTMVNVGNNSSAENLTRAQFPIVQDERDWPGSVGGRLPGVKSDHLTIVKKHQPFTVAEPQTHPLALLAKLGRIDKHHQIQVSVARGIEFRIEPALPPAEQGFFIDDVLIPPDIATLHFHPQMDICYVVGRERQGFEPDVKLSFYGIYQAGLLEGTVLLPDVLDLIGAKIVGTLSDLEPLL